MAVEDMFKGDSFGHTHAFCFKARWTRHGNLFMTRGNPL
jgi:hypothetical protein